MSPWCKTSECLSKELRACAEVICTVYCDDAGVLAGVCDRVEWVLAMSRFTRMIYGISVKENDVCLS